VKKVANLPATVVMTRIAETSRRTTTTFASEVSVFLIPDE
jgi:hypothetical protein